MAKETITEKPEIIEEKAEQIAARLESEIVPVYLPLEGAQGEESLFVSLNGKTWLVPIGKTTHVPRAIANLIRQKRRAQREAREFNEKQARRANELALR